MSKNWGGFTVVELIVVIVVLAILAAISLVGYGGIKQKAVASAVMSDLDKAKKAIDISSFDSAKPAELPNSFVPSKGNHVEIIKVDLPRYENMNQVQNGVLFYSICGDLVAAGYGRGTNNGGQMEQYITACNVYNNNQLQVNSSWSGHNFNTPVKANALQQVVDGIHYNDSWRPNRDEIEKNFYSTWNARFLAQGGEYPITSFWDGDWATPTNGVMKQDLPEPTPQRGKYCIEGYNESYPDMHYMVVNGGIIQESRCPASV